MSSTDHSREPLKQLARKMAANPDFMAYILAEYQRLEGLDEEALARRLSALPEMVVRLALCKRPEANSAGFEDQVSDLSDFTLIDENILADVLHHVDTIAERSVLAQPGTGKKSRPRSPWSLAKGLASAFAPIAGRQLMVLGAISIVFLIIGGLVWRLYLMSSPLNLAATGQPPSGVSSSDSPANRSTDASPRTARPSKPGGDKLAADRGDAEKPRKPPEMIAKVKVNLDSDAYTVLRDADSIRQEKALRVAPVRTRFLITLPSGSSKGTYSVSVVDAFGKPLIAGSSRSAYGKTLTIVLDMQGLRGKYRLSVSRHDEAPDSYPLIVGGESRGPGVK